MKKLVKFDKKVKAMGGKVILTSLIPRPREQDPQRSRNGKDVLRVLHELFSNLSARIILFNKANGSGTTPHLKTYLEAATKYEKKPKKDPKVVRNARVYYNDGDRENVYNNQRIIRTGRYESDGINIKESFMERIKEICVKRCLQDHRVISSRK